MTQVLRLCKETEQKIRSLYNTQTVTKEQIDRAINLRNYWINKYYHSETYKEGETLDFHCITKAQSANGFGFDVKITLEDCGFADPKSFEGKLSEGLVRCLAKAC